MMGTCRTCGATMPPDRLGCAVPCEECGGRTVRYEVPEDAGGRLWPSLALLVGLLSIYLGAILSMA